MRPRYSSTSSREETSPAAIASAWRAIPANARSVASIEGMLDGCDGIALGGPLAALARGVSEAADQVLAQAIRLDHGVDDKFRGQMQEVDVLGVLPPQLLGLGRSLRTIGDCLKLVVVDGIDGRLRSHDSDRGTRQSDAAVRVEGRPGHRIQAGAIGLAHYHRDLRHGG